MNSEVTGEIYGRVYYGDDKFTLRDVEVLVECGFMDRPESVRTDLHGIYRVVGLPAGQCEVRAEVDGESSSATVDIVEGSAMLVDLHLDLEADWQLLLVGPVSTDGGPTAHCAISDTPSNMWGGLILLMLWMMRPGTGKGKMKV